MEPREHFWQIDPDPSHHGVVAQSLKWINPRYIVCVEDHAPRPNTTVPTVTDLPTIQVTMATEIPYGTWDVAGKRTLRFTGHQREQILRYLADSAPRGEP